MDTLLDRSIDTQPSSLLRGITFRFAFIYWTLFCIPILSTQITGLEWLGEAIATGWNAMVVWVGHHVLGIADEIKTAENGSGDKTADYIGLFCIAGIALIGTIVWSLLDRRRQKDARLRELLRVLIRYTLAFILIGYGVSKLFFGQFPAPSAGRLLQRYGDSSPMGLLWTFMGASPAYVFFSGAGETIGSLLLLFRRTTTLGALVLGAVLTNIVMLNFCYDVPVKINSAHYLAMCVFLLLPDVRRLADVLLFNRPTQPVAYGLALPKRWMRVARAVVKFGAIAVVLFVTVKESAVSRSPASLPWYEGFWNVTTFARNGQNVPALVTDASRWSRISFQSFGEKTYVRWRNMDDSRGDLYTVALDEAAQRMTLTPEPASKTGGGTIALAFVRVDAGHIKIEGNVGTDALAVQLERFVPEKMLLVNRGFHWINEVPFNR